MNKKNPLEKVLADVYQLKETAKQYFFKFLLDLSNAECIQLFEFRLYALQMAL